MRERALAKLAFVGALGVLALACSLLPGSSGPGAGSGGDPSAEVLFADDFSDPNSGWDRIQADEGITDYADGRYRIFVNQPQHDYWANPGRSFEDVRVEVDATKAGGPDDNDFGLICRYQDTENFYAFLISSDGYFGVMKVAQGSSEMLGTDGLQSTDAIRQGATTNHIRGDCVGSQLTLYVNGEKVYSATDSAFSSGDVGLLAGTYDISGTDIHFDNFFVYEP